MSDKPRQQAGDFFAIPGMSVIALEGRDAVAFAQAQFMNDVAALAPGQWQWNGWLTPKGRVVALFALLECTPESLLLLLLDADADAFVSQLRRFVFRSKVVIGLRSDVQPGGRFSAPARAAIADFAPVEDDERGIELDFGTRAAPRTLRLGTHAPGIDGASAEAWLRFDLAHGLPRLLPSQAGQWTPQQLSLDRLKAFSVKKGCYPGQEIVARTHFLGQAKRGLVRLQGAGVDSLGDVRAGSADDTDASPRVLGQLVCACGGEALAVMPLDAGDGPFLANGHALSRSALLDGLAR